MRRAAWSFVGLLLLSVGCDARTPSDLLDGPRVIAVVADPPTIDTTSVSRLSLITAVDGVPTPPDAVRWRACSPQYLVVDPVRDCFREAAVPLAVDADGRAILDAAELAARFGAPQPPPEIVDGCGRELAPITIAVEAELAGARLIARKQVGIGVTPARQNPQFVRLLADGEPVVDGTALGADVATASLDRVCDVGDTEPSRAESVRVYLYPGGGATAAASSFDIVDELGTTIAGTVELAIPDEPRQFPLWWVAIDEGGGVAVVHTTFEAR